MYKEMGDLKKQTWQRKTGDGRGPKREGSLCRPGRG